PVLFAHGGEVVERPDLICQFLALTDHLVGRPHVVDLGALGLLGLEQAIDPVQRDAAVVTDDAAAAIGIWKAGDDAGLAASHDLGLGGIAPALVGGLPLFREGLVHLGVGLELGRLQARLDHAQAAVGKDRPLERLIGLQPDNDFVVTVDIAGLVRQQGRRPFGV